MRGIAIVMTAMPRIFTLSRRFIVGDMHHSGNYVIAMIMRYGGMRQYHHTGKQNYKCR